VQRGKESRADKIAAKPLSAHQAGKPAARVRETTGPSAEYGASRLTSATSALDALTPDQVAVLALIATPMSNSDAAKHRTTGTAAIKKHLEGVYQRLGVKTRADAIAIYCREREAASERDRQQLRQECARLRQENAELLSENAELRSENERLRKGGGRTDG
jgi:DNA-binding CsgD family transcriptional regulator